MREMRNAKCVRTAYMQSNEKTSNESVDRYPRGSFLCLLVCWKLESQSSKRCCCCCCCRCALFSHPFSEIDTACWVVCWMVGIQSLNPFQLYKLLNKRTTRQSLQKFENDETLTLSDVWRFEGNLIVTDALVFFVVGRLHRQKGVDHLAWMAWCLAANFYSSYITSFALFRHSFTPYEMHCLWPWQLWAFLLVLIPIIVTVAVWHVQHAWQERILVQICLEMIFCLTFLLAPLVASPYFHFHHWFAGFLVGMHFNFDVWWSRAAMAWCWGQYINGIAVYGRDPVLTCEYAYFMSVTQRCPFVHCYLEALDNPDHTFDNITVAPMIPPDWRNCSADSFHP